MTFLVILSGFALIAGDEPAGGDGDTPKIRLHGSTELSSDDEESEARGAVHIRQRGDRMALHVHVRNLAGGATYDVTASRTVTGEGGAEKTETAELGSITTREANTANTQVL